MRRTLVMVDSENNAESFWQYALNAADTPAALATIASGDADAQLISNAEAAALLRWCLSAPGWHGGPSYAPHPLLFQGGE